MTVSPAARPYGRASALSASFDYVHWTAPELIFYADDEDRRRAVGIIAAQQSEPERWVQPTHTGSDGTLENSDGRPAGCAVDVYNMGVFRCSTQGVLGYGTVYQVGSLTAKP